VITLAGDLNNLNWPTALVYVVAIIAWSLVMVACCAPQVLTQFRERRAAKRAENTQDHQDGASS
jgi:hypothetical protein